MGHFAEASERISLPYNNEKVTAQLAQLSIEEKVSLLAGSGFTTTAGIPRLDIPSLKVRICCHAQHIIDDELG